MTPRHGEVWLVDMGMVAKTRPCVVLIADDLRATRSLIIHVPITKQNRGGELEVPLGHLPFLENESVAASARFILRCFQVERNEPSPVLRTPSPIRWERDGVREQLVSA